MYYNISLVCNFILHVHVELSLFPQYKRESVSVISKIDISNGEIGIHREFPYLHFFLSIIISVLSMVIGEKIVIYIVTKNRKNTAL